MEFYGMSVRDHAIFFNQSHLQYGIEETIHAHTHWYHGLALVLVVLCAFSESVSTDAETFTFDQ
jgi:hypothetical protein